MVTSKRRVRAAPTTLERSQSLCLVSRGDPGQERDACTHGVLIAIRVLDRYCC
jgi:hypothetical protein